MNPPIRCLSVVVPVYNEIRTLRAILSKVAKSPFVQEIILVDDCSSDGTREILKEAQGKPEALVALDPAISLKIFFQPYNQGKGAALRVGIAQAQATYLIIQDADLEYDPADYGVLLEPLFSGEADAVFGSRFLGDRRRVLFYWHTVGNRLLTFLSNVCTNLNLTDMETCYKVFKTSLIQAIPLRSNRFGFEPEVTAKVAKLRCSVYEVPISYHGRGYADGKKINWKDGISAVFTILKYAFVDDLYNASAGLRTLRIMEGAGQYNSWLFNRCKKFLGRRVLEVGAGVGNITRFLLDRDFVVAAEYEKGYVEELKRTYASFPHVKVESIDLTDSSTAKKIKTHGDFDSVLCMNVLEHIENDQDAVRMLVDFLPAGGKVVLLVPSHPFLFSPMDKNLGHYRRYTKSSLNSLLEQNGCRVLESRYLNWLGALGWFINAKLLRRQLIPSRQLRVFDMFIGLLSLEKLMSPPFGLSVLSVAEKKRET